MNFKTEFKKLSEENPLDDSRIILFDPLEKEYEIVDYVSDFSFYSKTGNGFSWGASGDYLNRLYWSYIIL